MQVKTFLFFSADADIPNGQRALPMVSNIRFRPQYLKVSGLFGPDPQGAGHDTAAAVFSPIAVRVTIQNYS